MITMQEHVYRYTREVREERWAYGGVVGAWYATTEAGAGRNETIEKYTAEDQKQHDLNICYKAESGNVV